MKPEEFAREFFAMMEFAEQAGMSRARIMAVKDYLTSGTKGAPVQESAPAKAARPILVSEFIASRIADAASQRPSPRELMSSEEMIADARAKAAKALRAQETLVSEVMRHITEDTILEAASLTGIGLVDDALFGDDDPDELAEGRAAAARTGIH